MSVQRILLISQIFPPRHGGSGRWFWEVYRRLAEGAVYVLAGEHAGQAEFDASHSVPICRTRLKLPEWGIRSFRATADYWRLVKQVRQIVRREGITQLHCARCLPEGWIAWLVNRFSGIPYLCYAHGEDLNSAATSRELRWMTQRVLRGARLVIANSRNTSGTLTDQWKVPADKVRLLHPGMDAALFVPALRDRQERSHLGWDEQTVLLTVGRLQKRKGHDMLIRALPHIRQVVPTVLYSIIGDGEEMPELRRLAAETGVAGIVQFQGEVSDHELLRCYQQCDLFVLPNREVDGDIEGFGMVLLEAQACGKAVLAGASGGTAETMKIGETGRVVNCDGPHELAAAIVELLADRENLCRMGEAAREWVAERFDWPMLTRQAAAIFAELEQTNSHRRGRRAKVSHGGPLADPVGTVSQVE
jgi:phosphatidyl-myo-inositol dimannoside synthase